MISGGGSRRVAAAGLAIVLASSGCGSTAPTSTLAADPTEAPGGSASVGPVGASPGTTGVPAAATAPSTPGSDLPPDLLPDASPPPLPLPSLNDPFTIGEALYDPTRVADGVLSLLSAMDVSIDGAEPDAAIQLSEPEVWGLISMARGDLTADPEGSLPYTFADLHAGLAPFLPGVSARQLAASYAAAYDRRPDALVPGVLFGQPIEVETPLTRVHLWMLFADGFVVPDSPRTASLAGLHGPGPGAVSWGVAAGFAPTLTPPPGVHPADVATMLLRLRTVGFMLGLGVLPILTIHEGHGGPGRAQPVTAGLLGGQPIPRELAPFARTGSVRPFDLTLRTSDPSLWQSHGTLSVPFGQPQRTTRVMLDATFRPKAEKADGQGEYAFDVADIWSSAPAVDVVTSVFDLPIDAPTLTALLPGDLTSPPMGVVLEWHSDEGLRLALTNEFDIKLGLTGVVGIADASADGTDSIQGFLPRTDDGTYRGTILSVGDVHARCHVLGNAVDEQLLSRQSLDILAEVRPGDRSDPNLFRVDHGAFGPDDARLTFYPKGPPIDSEGECIGPITTLRGGPLDRSDLVYRWFNDSRWTDPTRGYTIRLPDSESSVTYRDRRLSREALSGPGGISGVHSVWTVSVTKIGH